MKQKLIDFLKKRETIVALISLVVFGVLLAVDLVTKAWAESTNVRQSAFFLGIVRFYFTKNTGMAFSWFDDNEAAMTVVTIFTVVLIVALAALFFTVFKRNTPARITLAVIEAGAIGNLIDRLTLGYVRDMVDVSPLGFGVCNFADFFITFGGVALREEAKEEEERKEALKAAAESADEVPSVQERETAFPDPDEEQNGSKHDE